MPGHIKPALFPGRSGAGGGSLGPIGPRGKGTGRKAPAKKLPPRVGKVRQKMFDEFAKSFDQAKFKRIKK